MKAYTNFLQRRAFQPRRYNNTQTALMVLDPALADLALPARDTDSAILTYGYSWLL